MVSASGDDPGDDPEDAPVEVPVPTGSATVSSSTILPAVGSTAVQAQIPALAVVIRHQQLIRKKLRRH